ncbi:hypothetical protein [uncultured Amphritea sp.]|uniref:hypothetical protein n=1 Tax=uncultured Amphritea sp. TaxID=981605 RepID=UPI0025E48317|nr:hypothetical protein [uncultured Amphritea sp.]
MGQVLNFTQELNPIPFTLENTRPDPVVCKAGSECHKVFIKMEVTPMFKKQMNFLALILVFLYLSGCASSIQMSKMDREAIGSIKVIDKVTTPEGMYYFGPGQQALILFGPLGGAVAGAIAAKPAEQIDQFARDNNIVIEQIVKEEFLTQLANSGKFKISNNEISDANLEIKIFMYGLTIPNGFSSELVPVLKVSASIINKADKIIWSNSGYIFGDDYPSHPLEEIKNNPDLLKEAWGAVAKQSIAKVLSTL